ncbi:MAG: hypothetical protein JWR85_3555 [Marmoricola sp.]|nr:hypothetical protein [Marmoricola sp.]
MMDKRLAEWFASNDTGSSSKSIALWLAAGVTGHHGADTPSDPSDLCRCLRLLDRIPEWKVRIAEMAGAGGLWPTFAERWSEIEASLLGECDGKVPGRDDRGWSCPATYELMKLVHDQAYAADKPSFEEVKFGSMTMRMRR